MKYQLLAVFVAGSMASVACDRNETEHTDAERNRDEAGPRNQEGEVNNTLQAARNEKDLKDKAEERAEDRAEDRADKAEDKREATELVGEAAATLQKMKQDAGIKRLLSESKGVFIVPKYGRGAVGVGARGGEGILIAHRNAQNWSAPAFYDLGGISIGAQFGGEGGEVAMILMSDEALKAFKSESTFSLNASADLTLVDYSALAQESLGKDVGNVVFWSGTKGAFAGVSLSVTDIDWDEDDNFAYHGKKVTPDDALMGEGSVPKDALKQQLTDI